MKTRTNNFQPPDNVLKYRSSVVRIGLVLTACLIILFILDLMTGSVTIGPLDVLRILSGGTATKPSWIRIIWLFRLPKAIAAVLAGSGLALSGLLMQTLFRNPLAGPSVLGINAGASLAVALVVLSTAGKTGTHFLQGLAMGTKTGLVAGAALGAGIVMLAILALARKVKDVMTLLIVGILGGFALNAAVSVLIHFSAAEQIQAYIVWTFGSFATVTWDDLALFAPVISAGLAACMLIGKPLNGLLLGEGYALSMGLRIMPLRIATIALTAMLSGTTTAFCGPVAFVGVAVPHMARVALDSSNHRTLLPVTAFCGALVALAADLLAQLPGSQSVLPLNAVTALIGAPVIVWLILKRGNLSRTFGGQTTG